jgi:hypothetical protein
MIVNDELVRIWKEVIVVYFMAVSWYLLERPRKATKISIRIVYIKDEDRIHYLQYKMSTSSTSFLGSEVSDVSKTPYRNERTSLEEQKE